jgi:hypothetical protein
VSFSNNLSPQVLNLYYSMKKSYMNYRNKMSATGVGLIESDREDEMTKGSDMFNIWGILYISVC